MKNSYIFAILFLFLPLSVNGAELTLKKNLEVVGVGDVFDVVLTLNTESQSINAIEATLQYSDNLRLEDVSNGNSIINLWISKPKLGDGGNVLFLSGLIPGGIKTTDGVVLGLTFKSVSGAKASIGIKDARAIINDPEATEAKIKTANFNFEIQSNKMTAPQIQKLSTDSLPPDRFVIYLAKDKNIFDNAWFISFNTQDKGSGISHYEIRERFLGLFGDWKRGESPYQLSRKNLFGIIEVRAVDNMGIERTERLIPTRLYLIWFLLIIVVIILILGAFKKLLKSHN